MSIMKYAVLAWLVNWEYLKEEGGMHYGDDQYRDAYFLVDSKGNLKLFDNISDAEANAKKECKYFKIIDFYNYRVGNKK